MSGKEGHNQDESRPVKYGIIQDNIDNFEVMISLIIRLIKSAVRILRNVFWRLKLWKDQLIPFEWSKVILVYQPGKVASSSITKALSDLYEGPVVHIHSFERLPKPHVLNSSRLELQKQGELPKVKIITLIRDPFSRNLSAFFQNLEKYQNDKVAFDGACYGTEGLWQLYMQSPGSEWILDWWDLELKKNFDIDVFSVPFPESGHLEIENDRASVLLLRYNLPDDLKGELVSKFVDIPTFDLSQYRANDSRTKYYAEEYEEMKKKPLPPEYFERMLNSQYCQHFYAKELSDLKEKWLTL